MAIQNEEKEPMELTDAQLESVVGGLTDLQKKKTEIFANDAMRNGLTLDEAVERALHPKFGSSHFDDEMIQYMIDYWNNNFS